MTCGGFWVRQFCPFDPGRVGPREESGNVTVNPPFPHPTSRSLRAREGGGNGGGSQETAAASLSLPHSRVSMSSPHPPVSAEASSGAPKTSQTPCWQSLPLGRIVRHSTASPPATGPYRDVSSDVRCDTRVHVEGLNLRKGQDHVMIPTTITITPREPHHSRLVIPLTAFIAAELGIFLFF